MDSRHRIPPAIYYEQHLLYSMFLFKRPRALDQFLRKHAHRRIGFVPTMGALHEGHVSLVEQAKADNGLVVCSIFVNPTQFNQASDLDKYPRTIANDMQMLLEVGCDVLFLPDVSDIYPKDKRVEVPKIGLGSLEQVLEAAFRPGHFEGMLQVVNRLLEIVKPNSLYMGQKDYQQFRIVESMLDQTKSSVKLLSCPIVRECDGLAMSSRNARLSPALRKQAPKVYQTLNRAAEQIRQGEAPADVCARALEYFSAQPDFKPEYFELVDGISLKSVESIQGIYRPILLTAVWVGDTRIIDNLLL